MSLGNGIHYRGFVLLNYRGQKGWNSKKSQILVSRVFGRSSLGAEVVVGENFWGNVR
ncbi:hypothetical protein CLV59_101838 [Chitinophaga dinghuensis]|uniref:Uncharacterized protein n=1 Tax=Chitinophaga dinghuensis TaxID=1539050 RepID=A0A327WBV5_9BACT|nr:hypothetical protein CLV59_101838 [Chitinophaga dinghuensis]